jgi:methyl-accepting chemotaxis protein
MIAGLALILGTAIAWFIGRGVTKPILALRQTMDLLASGNLDAEVPGTERGDELGLMAKSVLTFREAGRANIRLQQEAIEKDKQAVAASAKATVQVMEEFDAALGNIVTAAVAGDFSQRVDLAGKTGLFLKMGTAINSLCANVARAVDDLGRMLNSLAEGDLTHRITAEYHGNFALLKDNANKTAERIGTTIAEINASAREVTNASAEISASTTDLSQRSEEQAASLEQTTASMEQISATVKKNAENAQAANASAASTQSIAGRGGEVVGKAVEAMARIEESSRKISDIIGVIDEIARQTNLLALNAAVEAARAGEAGRGFAVVATEVRSLAQRSSQAAKDIKDLITNSNGQVKDGVELVNRAGTALTEIVESIKTVAAIVADIADASAEQADGIEQVNKALNQMDQVTQQNSALVEENAATAKTLEHQAKAMDERVAVFKIQDGRAGEAGSDSAVPARRSSGQIKGKGAVAA